MAVESQHASVPDDHSSQDAPARADFLVVHCEQCDRDVLAARDLDDEGRLVDVCVHCDSRLDRRAPSARWVGAAALDEHGYFVEGAETRDDRHGGGGCRGGSCGVQQPDR